MENRDSFGAPVGSAVLFSSGVELGQTAFAGFAETVVQVDAGLLHGPADHIVADVTGAGEEVAEVAGIHSPDGGNGVALDAGDLHQAADGVAGEAQMMLHGNFRGIFHLVQVLLVQFCQSGGSHGAGSADLGLAAALCAGNGGVGLGQIADDAGGGQTTADLLIGEALGDLGVLQNSGENTTGAAGGGGDHGAVVGILLGYSIGIGGDPLEFDEGGLMDSGVLFEEVLGLALDIEAAGQDAFLGKTFVNGVFHGQPDFHQEVPDLGTLVQLHIFRQGVDVAPFAEVGNFREGMFDIDFFGTGSGLFAGDPDVAAADGFHPQVTDFNVAGEGGKVHGVGMHTVPAFGGEENLRAVRAKGFQQHPVGAVAHTGFAQRAVKGDFEGSGIGIAISEQESSPFRTHGMGRRGAFADFIDLADGFHRFVLRFFFTV